MVHLELFVRFCMVCILAAVQPAHSLGSKLTGSRVLPSSAFNGPIAERRMDGFGGYGLFTNEAVVAGQNLLTIVGSTVVFAAAKGTLIDDIADTVSIEGDTYDQRCAWSIGASLATWRLLRDHPHVNENGDIADETIAHNFVGISTAMNDHAESLPWRDSQWQLPSLWSTETLDAALIHGFKCVAENFDKDSTASLITIESACVEAKQRVTRLRTVAYKLSGAVREHVQVRGGLIENAGFADIDLACLQAMAMVFSRSCKHISGKLALLPTIDCANHSTTPNARINSDQYQVDGESDNVILEATEAIDINMEVTISYGIEMGDNHPAERESHGPASFAVYGFIPSGLTNCQGSRALQAAAIWGQQLSKEELSF
jgi:hypothetical protein